MSLSWGSTANNYYSEEDYETQVLTRNFTNQIFGDNVDDVMGVRVTGNLNVMAGHMNEAYDANAWGSWAVTTLKISGHSW